MQYGPGMFRKVITADGRLRALAISFISSIKNGVLDAHPSKNPIVATSSFPFQSVKISYNNHCALFVSIPIERQMYGIIFNNHVLIYMDALRVCLLQPALQAELDTGWFGSFSGNIYIC